MSDIIASVPWSCGDKTCPVGWHLSNYWDGDGGITVDHYADGDHEAAEEGDVPSAESVDEAWATYARFVAETGRDPLHEYTVKRTRTVTERWSVKIGRSILGLVVADVRRNRRRVEMRDIPAHVREYLTIAPESKHRLILTATEADVPEVKVGRWHPFAIEREAPRPARVVAAELRRAAKRTRGAL